MNRVLVTAVDYNGRKILHAAYDSESIAAPVIIAYQEWGYNVTVEYLH